VRIVVWVLRVLAALAALALVGGYLGALHPLGDSLAVFRLWVACGLLALCLGLALARDRALALVATVAALSAASPVLWGMFSGGQGPDRPEAVVYVKNLGSGRADMAEVIADVAALGADILLLQELTHASRDALQMGLPDHPHWHICQFSGWSGIAIVSRWPLSEPLCTDHRSAAAAMIDAPGGPIWASSVHQLWPYPYAQARLLPNVLELMAQAEGRRVVGGDFNMVPWAYAVREIARVSGTERIGPIQATIDIRGVRMPIDHVLTDGQGGVDRRPRFGSDHYGLIARIAWGN